MKGNFFISQEEKERLFHTQLVKYGVKFEKAAKVAKILASGESEESWTEEERQLVTETCEEWLKAHKRHKQLVSLFQYIKR
ncbi:unknown protein [Nostoc sp. NIES-3756]|uniref:hypothetical protein n=1 Tax=Nostoc sp. NIES-3756 TaxID=1751286 RepID=UPI000720B384|nr:hypothetical protein [Nostoc sp. NIES-3756]BAT55664.1 unknown protein [Nostoc sp. NIES-3756]